MTDKPSPEDVEDETEVILVRKLKNKYVGYSGSVEELLDVANEEIGPTGAYFKQKPSPRKAPDGSEYYVG